MVKDDRLYGRFTLDFPDSPKIMPLSDAAFRAIVEMTLYSRRMKTDGFVSKRLALAKWGLEVCQELATNDDAKPSLIEREDGYQIHDFADHQSTKAEIEALTNKRKVAGQKGGRSKALASAKQVPQQKSGKTYPETETETETIETANAVSPSGNFEGGSHVSNAGANEPPRKCSAHINDPTDRPCRGCGDARQAHEAWTAANNRQQAAARSEAARTAAADRAHEISMCQLCDHDGYQGPTLCDHDSGSAERTKRGIALVRAALKNPEPGVA